MSDHQEELLSTTDIVFDLERICLPEFGTCDLQIPISAGKLKHKNKDIEFSYFKAKYDHHLDVILEFAISGVHVSINSRGPDLKLAVQNSSNELEVLYTQTTLNSVSETVVTATPVRAPYFFEFNENAKQAKAYIINGPETFFTPLDITFETPDSVLVLRESDNSRNYFRNKKRHRHDYLITHYVEIESKSERPLSVNKAFSELGHLSKILTFAKGGHVGVGHISGTNSLGQCCFFGLGFSRSDHFQLAAGWFGIDIIKRLPEIFSLYISATSTDADRRIISRTMEFYRAASIARTYSTETAIITSFAGLETIVPHILQNYGGWSQSLISKKIPFHEKFRAASTLIGLNTEPLEHARNLKKRTKDFNDADAYEILSVFRNRIVHQGKQFEYSGQEIYEAWLLSQWFCEIFLFFLLKYRGPIYESRQLQGFKGPAIQVPLS